MGQHAALQELDLSTLDSVALVITLEPNDSFTLSDIRTVPIVPESPSLALPAVRSGALAGWCRWRKRPTA